MLSKSINKLQIITISASFKAYFISSVLRLVLIGMGRSLRFLIKGYLLVEQLELEGFQVYLLVRNKALEINPLSFTAWRLLFEFSFTSFVFFAF